MTGQVNLDQLSSQDRSSQKILDPKFFGVKLFLTQHFCKPNICFLTQHCCLTQNICEPKNFCWPNFFWTQHFFEVKHFFWTQNFLRPKSFLSKILLDTKNFLNLDFFGPSNFLYSKSFWTQNALEN